MAVDFQTFSGNIQRLINRLARFQGLSDRILLEEIGVTTAQAYTLLSIPEDGSLTMNELSETLWLANSTMTRTVDQLVDKSLVERFEDSEDRRIVRVRLSSKGLEQQATVKWAMQHFFEEALRDIPEAERETILRSFESIDQAIVKGLASCCGITIPGL